MKSTILKSIQLSTITASLASFLISGFVLSNAYAGNFYLNSAAALDSIIVFGDDNPFIAKKITVLRQRYGDIVNKEYEPSGIFYLVIHGTPDQPKPGAFTIETIPKDKEGNNLPPKKLVLGSQQEATDLCSVLSFTSPPSYPTPSVVAFHIETTGSRGQVKHINRVIMVPYTIAYDTGSQEASDGTSTPATKYVMCPNFYEDEKQVLDPSRNSENEVTGIVSSKLNEAKTEYTVTCMPASGKKRLLLNA